MPVKAKIPFDNGHFFISFTCYKWLQLFELTDGYDLVYEWFDLLKKEGHYITGFVVMPNHVHATIAFRKSPKSIQTIIREGKKMIAWGMVKRLNKLGYNELLEQLQDAVSEKDKKKGKLYQLWETGFDWTQCTCDDVTLQKLDYIHDNPCTGRWRLSDNAADYWHSSARFYLLGIAAAYKVLHFKELAGINLTVA